MRYAADEAGVALEERVADAPTLLGDRDRLLQVVLNLVSNAVKFAPRSTRVVVSAARGEGGVRIAVEDAGPGIAAVDLPLLFQKFRQLAGAHANRAGGSGLGLAIAKAIVEAHGGTIDAESSDSGTTFTIRLPRDPAAGERGVPDAVVGSGES
jgi:signal transduction histidine kinase